MKTIISAILLAAGIFSVALVLGLIGTANATCVPSAVLADARTAAGETWRAPGHVTRWSRVLAGFGESNAYSGNPMTVAEAQAQVDRGLQRWVPIHAALECLANPPQVEVEVQPAVEEVEVQPTVNVEPEQTSLNLPTYPAPTAHSGWFGWNAPNQIRRVSGSGPVPAQCKAKASKVRQEIIDSDWHISTMRKHWYELHTDRRSWWFTTVKNIGCNVRQSWDDPDGYAKCVGIGDRTAYNRRGPNGEASGKWQWTRAPLPSIYAAQGAYASYDDWGDNSPSPVQYGVLQCGTASEQTGGAVPTASMHIGVIGQPTGTTHTVNEGDDWVEISLNYLSRGQLQNDYTVVFGDGTAKMGTDYKVQIRGQHIFYANQTFKPGFAWKDLSPMNNRVQFRLGHGTSYYAIRIKALTDNLHGEGPETVTVKFEKPSPQINTLSYRKSYCSKHGEAPPGRNRARPCLEYTGDHYELGSMTGSGFHGYQGWSDPNARSVTLTINDRANGATLDKVERSIRINDLTLVEGEKAPGLRAVGCAPRWWRDEGGTDEQWCSGYHRIIEWTAEPHVCIYGALVMTGGNINAGFGPNNRGDINGYSWLRDQSTGVGRSHALCGSGSKQVYIRSNSDSYDEGTESATISFAVDRVLNDHQWDRVSSVSVTPGTLTITNDGPMPAEYLSRTGHSMASHLVQAVSDRAREAGDVSLPGVSAASLDSILGSLPEEGGEEELKAALLDGAAIGAGAGNVTTWARTSRTTFASRMDDFNVDGEQVHATVGLDGTFGKYTVGGAITYADGSGSYTGMADAGEAGSTLWAWSPYAIWNPSRVLSLWGTIGYGVGDVAVTPADNPAMEAGTDWRMGATGLRWRLFHDFDLVADTFWQRIASADTDQLAPSSSETRRTRAGFEGQFGLLGLMFSPAAHVVHEAGDIGDDTAVELGMGMTGAWGPLAMTADGSMAFGSRSEWDTIALGLSYATRFGSPSVRLSHEDMALGWQWSPFDGLMFDVEGNPGAEAVHGRATVRW